MGTFLTEKPSEKIARALKVVKNREELIPGLPEAKDYPFMISDYKALHLLLEDGLYKVKAIEEESLKTGINLLEMTGGLWLPPLVAACYVLGEDPSGYPVTKDGNPVNID